MILPDKKYINWFVLIFFAASGIGVSLWGYYQIINIQPPTSISMGKTPKNIFISMPKTNTELENPARITGKARSETGAIIIILSDANGSVIKNVKLDVQKDTLMTFDVEIKYEQPNSSMGVVQVSPYPMNDLQPGSKRSILIRFAK